MRRLRLPLLLLLAALLLALALTGCEEIESSQDQAHKSSSKAAVAKPKTAKKKPKAKKQQPKKRSNAKPPRWKNTKNRVGTARWMLVRVARRAEMSSASYNRGYFGGGWWSRNGCTTRQRVLIRQSTRGAKSGCAMAGGYWLSTYDGLRTHDPRKLEIDHLVPLAEAWRSGASRWSAGTRERYANDMGYSGTLRAVSVGSNRSKSDGDPAVWMPPRRIHHCKYIGTWIAVKYRWRLSTDVAERQVLARYVRECKRKADVPIPKRAVVRISKHPIGTSRPRTKSTPRTLIGKGTSGRTDRRYSTCKEAIAHGLGPYKRGRDAEYNWYHDADKDGLVCEH